MVTFRSVQCHPGLTGVTYIFNFWYSGTLALRDERQSARMSEIKNVGSTWMAKCNQLTSLPFKGLNCDLNVFNHLPHNSQSRSWDRVFCGSRAAYTVCVNIDNCFGYIMWLPRAPSNCREAQNVLDLWPWLGTASPRPSVSSILHWFILEWRFRAISAQHVAHTLAPRPCTVRRRLPA